MDEPIHSSRLTEPVVHLAIAFDERYLRPFYTLLESILQHHVSSPVSFHVIATGVSEDDMERIKRYIVSRGSDITYYSIDQALLTRFVLGSHWTIAVYYRLFFPLLVSPDVVRLLYLDTDILVVNDLSQLYTTSLGLFPAGAAYDTYVKVQPLLGIEKPGEYFNSGVLLIDTAAWKNQRISERAMEYLTLYPERIKFVDQCALNAVLRGNWFLLPEDYNRMYSSIPQDIGRTALNDLIKTTVVIHFTLHRPWHMLCKSRLRNLYFYFLKRSPLVGRSKSRYDDFEWKKISSWLMIRVREFYQDTLILQQIWRSLKRRFQR